MKKQSPMKMRQAPKNDSKASMNKSTRRPKSAMERYADQRNASLKATLVPTIMEHDPQSDLYHLQKAAEIQSDKPRHRAAKAHGKKKLKDLQKVLG